MDAGEGPSLLTLDTPMHANGRLWYYLFGKDIGCALLCRIFRILKRILVWNWQLLKQARIRSWESWSARWSYRWATSRKRLPRLRRTSEWMCRTYVMDLCPNTFWRVSSSIPLSMARTANAWRARYGMTSTRQLHFLPMIPRLSRMALYSPTGKTHSGSLSFHPYPYIFQSVR